MVTTRRQKEQQQKQEETRPQDGLAKQSDETPAKRARTVSTEDHRNEPPDTTKKPKNDHVLLSSSTNAAPTAKCPANQSLLDALQNLQAAVSKAQVADSKLRFQATQLSHVLEKLAQLDDPITSGKALASGPEKVEGLGPKTASFIDDYLETGSISAIQHYQQMYNEHMHKKDDSDNKNHDANNNNIIEINRAPILTLWVMIVSQRQGYTRDEALTHAKWISTILARSKGKALGKLQEDERPGAGGGEKEYSSNASPKEQVFGHIKVPVQSTEPGHRLALLGQPIDPRQVEQYLQNSLGGNLERAQKALWKLADSMKPDELRSKAYDLYEQLRPEWQGWGQPGHFDLDKVQGLVNNKAASTSS